MKNNFRVLCLADNTSKEAWGHKLTEKFARENNFVFRGAVTHLHQNLKNGCYYTGPVSMQQKDILDMAKQKFDKIVLIDQEQEKFSHFRIFLDMWKLVKDMKKAGIDIEIVNQENMQYLYDWEDRFTKNRSICVLPFTEIHNHGIGGLNLCGRNMGEPIHEEKNFPNSIEKWSKGKNINKIREDMLNGKRIDRCKSCRAYEDRGIKDQRWNYSFDWIARLKIKNINDLKKIKTPLHYNLRLSNKCNLMCRMCSADYSHLIEKEDKNIQDSIFKNIRREKEYKYNAIFENVDLDNILSIYITGGEPTFNPVTYNFLQKCIDINKTDLTINIQTNAAKITPKFFSLTKQFKNMTMNCSVDGVGKVNEYQRWLLKSDIQHKNIINFYRQGHHIHIIHVVSIYNVSTIGDTMNYFDTEFPFASVQLQWAGFGGDILSPYNHPNRSLVLISLQKAKESKCYWHNESGTTEIINNLYDFYKDPSSKPELEKLKKFFYYNDILDKHRGSKLADYIPELEDCRKYIK